MAHVTGDVKHVDLGHTAQGSLLGAQTRPKSRGEQLADAIRAAIRERGLDAGDFFGTLESIREETGLARTTVSDAVNLLRDRGVLVVRPGRNGGLFVAKTTPFVRLRHTLMRFDEDPTTVADAIELRESLEELIAVKAAHHRSEKDVADMEAVLEEMCHAPTWDDFMQLNWALHRRIAEVCPNSMARAVYESTLGFLTGGHAEQDDEVDSTYRQTRQQVHDDLVAAIASGDTRATIAAVAAHRS